MSQLTHQYPAIQGLTWHRTQYYSFFLPMDWHSFCWDDDREGHIYGPDPDDPSTVFAVNTQDLGTTITADDLDILAEGFFEYIECLPACHIDSRRQKISGKLLELEAQYTFQEDAATRKCWKRVFFHGTRQIVLTAQGATPEKYDYWLPWFSEAMVTAKIHKVKPTSPVYAPTTRHAVPGEL